MSARRTDEQRAFGSYATRDAARSGAKSCPFPVRPVKVIALMPEFPPSYAGNDRALRARRIIRLRHRWALERTN